MPDEMIELVKMPELDFFIGALMFYLPKPFKPEIYGSNAANHVIISTDSEAHEILGNLSIISALRNAYIHKIPCEILIRFGQAQIWDTSIPGGIRYLPDPHPQSFYNSWKVISLYYREQ